MHMEAQPGRGAHITPAFTLIVSSALQTAAKEVVAAHLSPSNQVLRAFIRRGEICC